jgi:hypothetical protein
MKKMKITLRKDGRVNIEVLGAVGDECVQFTKQLEGRLGTPLGSRTLKPEYHETQTETQRDHEVER